MSEIKGHSSQYRQCVRGDHWGPYGAAGVLPYTWYRGRLFVMLAKRSPYVNAGNTWSTIGGAMDAGETPTVAALREMREEVTITDRATSARVAASYATTCPACGWSYTTVLVRVRSLHALPRVEVAKGKDSWETSDVTWMPADMVGQLRNLHPGFAASWPRLMERMS